LQNFFVAPPITNEHEASGANEEYGWYEEVEAG
jgi:hypothetical protein